MIGLAILIGVLILAVLFSAQDAQSHDRAREERAIARHEELKQHITSETNRVIRELGAIIRSQIRQSDWNSPE